MKKIKLTQGKMALVDKENVKNVRGRHGTSKYKGVCFEKSSGFWRAQIGSDCRKRNLGRYRQEIDAARAYDMAAIKLHGKFAKLNFQNGT